MLLEGTHVGHGLDGGMNSDKKRYFKGVNPTNWKTLGQQMHPVFVPVRYRDAKQLQFMRIKMYIKIIAKNNCSMLMDENHLCQHSMFI